MERSCQHGRGRCRSDAHETRHEHKRTHISSGSQRRTAERSSAGDPGDAKAEARATQQRDSAAGKDKYNQRRLRPDVVCNQRRLRPELYDLTTMRQTPIKFFYSENTDNQRRLRSRSCQVSIIYSFSRN